MGLRFRKSINLGGGFKINLSKSGIGYSWGFPGYRHTYSPNGTQRKTYSIPGTGISYVESTKRRKNSTSNGNKNIPRYNENTKLITGPTTYYENSNISSMGKGDVILKQISKIRIIDIIANVCLISFYLIPIGIILKLLIAYRWKIDLTYEMDEINQKKFESLNAFLQGIQQNKKIWQIGSATRVYNTKYNAGAGNNVIRHRISIVKKMPWYIKKNVDVYCLQLTNEKIYFTPDRMLIFKNIGGVGCRKYNDMSAQFSTTNFVESELVSSDSEIVDYTWRYVNKSGGPDKRFNNNRKIPICKYGEISLTTEDGINILMEYSNHRLISMIQSDFEKFMDCHNTIISTKGYKEEYEIEYFDEENLNSDVNVTYENPINEKNNVESNKYDKWNKYNDEYDNLQENINVNETIKEPIIIEQEKHSEIEETSNKKNEKNIEDNVNENINIIKIKNILCIVLCYVQVFFSSILVLACFSSKMIFGTIMWSLVAIIFIPKIKEIIVSKNEKFKSYIIPIRIILVVLAFFTFVSFDNQFQGNWINNDNSIIIIDSSKITMVVKSDKQIFEYTYSNINDQKYDILYEITGKNENDKKIVLRYYKNESEEFLCIYENKKCNEKYTKVESN